MADRIITVTDVSVVTNDTLLGYNNYSNQDGQLGTMMTPTEAANGQTITLTDGLVHSVTTKPVGTTNGEFTGVVSAPVVVDLAGGGPITPLLYGFTGVEDPITTDADWENANTKPLDIRCKKNNNLEIEALRVNSTGEGDCQIKSVDAFDITTLKVLKFDIQKSRLGGQTTDYYGFFKNDIDTVGTADSFCFQIIANGDLRCTWRNTAGTADNTDFPGLDFVTSAISVKIVLDTGTANYYYWNGSAWLVADTKSYDTTGSLKVDFTGRNFTGVEIGDTTTITDVYVTDVDYDTQNPSV